MGRGAGRNKGASVTVGGDTAWGMEKNVGERRRELTQMGR